VSDKFVWRSPLAEQVERYRPFVEYCEEQQAKWVEDQYRSWLRTHYNLITPNVLEYKATYNRVVELSEGEFLGHKLYGVSVLRLRGRTFGSEIKLGRCFESLGEAREYYEELIAG